MNAITKNPLLRVVALLWLCAAMLAGCSQEPTYRKAFIQLLQTRLIDKTNGTFPILTAEDKKLLGEDYAKQYAVIEDFNRALNDSVGAPARQLMQRSSFNSIGGIMQRRDDLKTLQDGFAKLQVALDENLVKADAAHAAMKQPEDLKAVYDQAYAKAVSKPAEAFKEVFPELKTLFASINKVVDFVDAHKDKIKVSGMMVEVQDPALHKQLSVILNEMNQAGTSLNAAQNKLLKTVRGQ